MVPISVGGSHHFQARKKEDGRTFPAAVSEASTCAKLLAAAGVIVVRGGWFN